MNVCSRIAVVALLIVVSSCAGSGEKKIISVEKKIVLKEPAVVHPNRELSVIVSGMSCEHACGGAIRMALKGTNAVDRCSFDFVTDRKENTAFITFDKDKISADEIIQIIEELNDGQFTTGKTTTKTIETEHAAVSPVAAGDGGNSEAGTLEMSSPAVELPNVFDLLSYII